MPTALLRWLREDQKADRHPEAGVRIALNDVLERSILVEAMDLVAVTLLEETKEITEEVVDLDDGMGDG